MESIKVNVLEKNPEFLYVELPFLEVPVKMDHAFFQKRVNAGYFKIN
jgi:hypothetical protein